MILMLMLLLLLVILGAALGNVGVLDDVVHLNTNIEVLATSINVHVADYVFMFKT